MIPPETRAAIRRYLYAEHWKIGTIARELNVHPDAVRNAIESERLKSTQPLRASIVDPYVEFMSAKTRSYLSGNIGSKPQGTAASPFATRLEQEQRS
jgi:enamine deaminase RidA (YjgF/YER057c/UK114 family)